MDLNEEINLYYANLIARLTIGIDGSRGEYFLLFGEKGTLHIKDFHMARTAEAYGECRETYRARDRLLL